MIVSQYGSVNACARTLGINRDQFNRQLRAGSPAFLDAIADGCRLSRQEVRWEFRYYREQSNT